MNARSTIAVAWLAGLAAVAAPAAAQTTDRWTYGAAIYGWFPSIGGKTTFPPRQGGTSVTGVTLKPTTVRQRELVVETPGLPKYGFRYAAPLDQFSEDTWAKIQGSITVRAGGSGDSGDATGSVS